MTAKYHGKRYLYDFLKEHGYDVPAMQYMKYKQYRGCEWLKYFEIDLYSPARGVIFVTIYGEDENSGKFQKEYSKYVDGVLDYQKINGKTTIMFGKAYEKISV